MKTTGDDVAPQRIAAPVAPQVKLKESKAPSEMRKHGAYGDFGFVYDNNDFVDDDIAEEAFVNSLSSEEKRALLREMRRREKGADMDVKKSRKKEKKSKKKKKRSKKKSKKRRKRSSASLDSSSSSGSSSSSSDSSDDENSPVADKGPQPKKMKRSK
jgi:topoisomerase IA-like protein